MNTAKITPSMPKVKSHGPFTALSLAIQAGKRDPDAQRIGTLTIIKVAGAYDYVVGSNPALFPFDTVICRYYFLNGHVWSYPDMPAKQETTK